MCDNPKCRGKLKDTIINFGQDLPHGVCMATEIIALLQHFVCSCTRQGLWTWRKVWLVPSYGIQSYCHPSSWYTRGIVRETLYGLMIIWAIYNVIQGVGERGKRLVIVNLQTTPLDSCCKLRIFAKCDDVSKMLMSKLGMEIPEFRLKRYNCIYIHCH